MSSLWANATKVWTSDSGSAGVVFIAVRNDSLGENGESLPDTVYAVKGSSRIAQESFATSLGALIPGLRFPTMRLVQFTEPEWGEIKNLLNEQLACMYASNSTAEEVSAAYAIRQKLVELDRPFFHVMDFVPGAPLMCNYNTGAYFNTYRGAGTGRSTVSDESFGHTLGKIIAFDIFINNSDRIPTSVHDNEGNASNLMLQPKTNDTVAISTPTQGCVVVAIDTCVATIDPVKQRKMLEFYIHRVHMFLERVHDTTTPVAVSLRQVREFLQNETCHESSDTDLMDIISGVRAGVQSILTVLTKDILRAELENLRAMVAPNKDWEGVWAKSVDLVSLDSLYALYDCFDQYRGWEGGSGRAGAQVELSSASTSTSVSVSLATTAAAAVNGAGMADRVEVANLLLLQMHPARSGKLLGDEIASQLRASAEKGPAIDFVVLPEGCLGSFAGVLPSGRSGNDDLNGCGEMVHIANIAKQFQCYVICGTVWELPGDDNLAFTEGVQGYITCVVIGPNGKMVCKYRKRETLGCAQPGTEVGVFSTRFGKAAILICADVENRGVVAETLAEQPVIIFNPTHLISPPTVGNTPGLANSGWKLALDSSAWYLEYLCSQHNVSVVRVDHAGSGNSFVCTPGHTMYAPSKYQENMQCKISIPAAEPLQCVGDISICCPPRTARHDNSGVRLLYRALQYTHTPSRATGPHLPSGKEVLAVASFSCHGRPRGYLVVVHRGSVEVWDVATVTIFYQYELTGTTSFVGNGGRCCADGSVFVVYDNQEPPQVCIFTRNPSAAAGERTAAYTVRCTDSSGSNADILALRHLENAFSHSAQEPVEICTRKSTARIAPTADMGIVDRTWRLKCIYSDPTISVNMSSAVITTQESCATDHGEERVYYHFPSPMNSKRIDFLHYNRELQGLLCLIAGERLYILQLFCNKTLKRLEDVLN